MATISIKRQGKEVAKVRAAKLEQLGINRYIWKLTDAAGELIGTIYFTTKFPIEVEVLNNETGVSASVREGKDQVREGEALPSVQGDGG